MIFSVHAVFLITRCRLALASNRSGHKSWICIFGIIVTSAPTVSVVFIPNKIFCGMRGLAESVAALPSRLTWDIIATIQSIGCVVTVVSDSVEELAGFC